MAATHAQRRAIGDYGERLAARYLTEQGLTVVDRNWRCSQGEIDIVAVEGDVVAICEVKTRGDVRFGTPLEAITVAKAARLYRLGARWLAAHPALRGRRLRVDAVAIVRRRRGGARIEHVRGVV